MPQAHPYFTTIEVLTPIVLKILVTGAAGFIGFHVCKKLLESGHTLVGLDNINGYYDINLKFARLKELGILQTEATPFNIFCSSKVFGDAFRFIRMDVENREKLPKIFRQEKFDVVCHLAAQAGVRYSIENPEVYIDSNIVGFANVLECCRYHNIRHLVYASSSSIYGLNKTVPFKENDKTENPISLYAATKKSNELLAHTYSHLFGLPSTGLRFFTVYGPWGRPDMALFLFTDAILKNRPIKIFNKGNMARDFTYIEDIAKGVVNVTEGSLDKRLKKEEYYKIYNIGNNKSQKLTDFIREIENYLGKHAEKKMMSMQQGDMINTWAETADLAKDYLYTPETEISVGIPKFIDWYKEYYQID